jgi:hypothetical protein
MIKAMKKLFFLAGAFFFFLVPLAAQENPAEKPPEEAAPAETPPAAENQAQEIEPEEPHYYNIIAHVMDDDLIFQIDPQADVGVGDLYTLVRGGKEIGLLIINEVQETFAVARVLSSDEKPALWDEAREASRAGIEATFYGGSFLKTNYSSSYMPLAGLKLVLSRGFFYTRPVLEIEFPFARVHPEIAPSGVVPFNILAGAEITNLYFGRFQLASVMLLGMGWAYMGKEAQEVFLTDKSFHKTHISGKAFLSLSFLASRHVKLTAEAGILALIDFWPDLSDIEPGGYFGRMVAPFATFGLTIR